MINATVERTLFHNRENGYIVLSLVKDGTYFTATGVCGYTLDKGEEVDIEGAWIDDPKHGKQFKTNKLTIREPSTTAGVLAYLSSGIIPHIGPVTAEKIVKKFGERALQILDEDPDRLLEVPGIGKKTLEKINASWNAKRADAKTMTTLCSMGLSISQASKALKEYGYDAVKTIRDNPYALADDIWGIGFKRADDIALKNGFANDSPFRIQAGITYASKEAQTEGHCHIAVDALLAAAKKLLDVPEASIRLSVSELLEAKKLIEATVRGRQVLYLPVTYRTERAIEKKLAELTRQALRGVDFEPEGAADSAVLTAEQIDASITALTHRLSIITGSAGTGKTTTLKAILYSLGKNGLTYCLCAPTGKAAKRMTEVTGKEAKTIHRLLEVDKFGKFKRNDEEPLDSDFVIVDEATMVDVFLMNHLIKALPLSATLILIGDANQLPPVGAGNVFKDIIHSGICPVRRLTKIQRQKETSNIISIANQIKDGVVPYIDNQRDVFFFKEDRPTALAAKIVELVTEKIPKKFGIKFDDIQAISPMKKGDFGTHALNKLIQEKILKGKTNTIKQFKAGDRVMQLKNNYDKDIYNGDVGRIKAINHEEQKIIVAFDKDVEYDLPESDELGLAYAVTCHKYQGSEAQCIVMPVHAQQYMMLRRDLLYTAATRAKQILVIVGTYQALAMAVKNNQEQTRNTGLFAGVKAT